MLTLGELPCSPSARHTSRPPPPGPLISRSRVQPQDPAKGESPMSRPGVRTLPPPPRGNKVPIVQVRAWRVCRGHGKPTICLLARGLLQGPARLPPAGASSTLGPGGPWRRRRPAQRGTPAHRPCARGPRASDLPRCPWLAAAPCCQRPSSSSPLPPRFFFYMGVFTGIFASTPKSCS